MTTLADDNGWAAIGSINYDLQKQFNSFIQRTSNCARMQSVRMEMCSEHTQRACGPIRPTCRLCRQVMFEMFSILSILSYNVYGMHAFNCWSKLKNTAVGNLTELLYRFSYVVRRGARRAPSGNEKMKWNERISVSRLAHGMDGICSSDARRYGSTNKMKLRKMEGNQISCNTNWSGYLNWCSCSQITNSTLATDQCRCSGGECTISRRMACTTEHHSIYGEMQFSCGAPERWATVRQGCNFIRLVIWSDHDPHGQLAHCHISIFLCWKFTGAHRVETLFSAQRQTEMDTCILFHFIFSYRRWSMEYWMDYWSIQSCIKEEASGFLRKWKCR